MISKLFLIATIFSVFQVQAASMVKIQTLPSSRSAESCDPNPGSCKVIDQSGSLEPWECRDSDGKIRCYADVEYGNGTRLRIWGSCVSSYSDCWGSGAGNVDPCN